MQRMEHSRMTLMYLRYGITLTQRRFGLRLRGTRRVKQTITGISTSHRKEDIATPLDLTSPLESSTHRISGEIISATAHPHLRFTTEGCMSDKDHLETTVSCTAWTNRMAVKNGASRQTAACSLHQHSQSRVRMFTSISPRTARTEELTASKTREARMMSDGVTKQNRQVLLVDTSCRV